ncbi:MAG: tRNA (adenosine(37)-N6)-dimethylallyltransferase MiaA [Solobacterium sp.]|nr:tRNA (adenosine(37)-N6)-dimethylallyltransferase MiaA [Solobacterium sp.]
MKKVLVIAGPTASGKTSFSVSVAKAYGGYVISGDSVQVYRGLNIGSGKVRPEEMQGIRHELIDILDPDEQYSVSDFQKNARAMIDASEELPIIVGGTGLYLKACLYDYDFVQEAGEVHTDPELDTYTNEELYGMLRERDPAQAEKIHINNRRRLLRSLTILRHTGIPQGEMVASQRHEMIYDAMIVGCTMERQKLHERIALRVRQMAAEGLEDEVRALAEKYGFRAPGMQGIGYKEWEAYFAGEISREEVIEKIIVHSRQYARRQYTWLNHQMPVHWFDSTDPQDAERMRKEIGEWIRDCRE